MKHSYLTFLGILSCSSLWAQQEPSFNFTENKQIITTFSDAKISLGEKKVIFGQEQSMPGIYLKDNGQTYEAFRLTVEPPQTLGRWKPYLQIPTASSILINWKASAGEDAKVRYGTVATQLNLESTGQSEELADDSDVFSYYSVKLKDLKADTKYYYTIAGDQTVYSFRTQPTIGNKRHYRVLMLGDHQLINRSGYEWL
ncbi:MAG: fibronectin type III domain-containing protein, partial [Bacteroidaceae bacterium]